MPKGKARHGVVGVLLGLVTLVVPGSLAVIVGVLHDVLPADWLRYQEPLTEDSARGLALVMGVGLLVVAKGYFSFWRLGWLGYVVWALIGVLTLVGWLTMASERTPIQAILVILGLPYLWVRRRSFGIGPQPNVGGA